MKRIFSRKRRDYRLFAAALAFGFTATLAAYFVNQPSPQNTLQPIAVRQVAAGDTQQSSTVAFAYASETANNPAASNSIFQPLTNAVHNLTAPKQAAAPQADRQRYLQPVAKKPLSMTEVVQVGKGDTLNQIFEAFNVPKELSMDAIESLKGIFSPRDFRVGQQITLLFKPNTVGGRDFRGYRFAADPLSDVIVMDDSGNGSFDATVVKKELVNVIVAKKAVITGSLMGAAARAGVPHNVVAEMIRVYSHSVDFQRDIHEGDHFEVMYYARADKNGKVHATGDMTYARLVLDDKEYPIYRYQSADGSVDYYKADGTSNRRGLIRTPIDGARITSGFGFRRHPILGYSKMHKGIDFGAAKGTPIFAAGDGVIAKAGWVNGYGNYVKINHNAKLATAYGHMSRFAGGMRPGVRVKQGQVIGYVGATGRATGPHLHYEIMMGGVQVNPVGVKVPTSHQLAGRDMQKFKLSISARKAEFRQAMINARTTQTASR